MRLPKQVLIIPYKIENNAITFCLFKRSDMQIWQWIAGGVEDFDRDLLTAAKRECFEEAKISNDAVFTQLEGYCKIPVVNLTKENFKWGKDVYYSEEYAFAVNITNEKIILSDEHNEFAFFNYDEARKMLKYDSNKSALWELNEKIMRGLIK